MTKIELQYRNRWNLQGITKVAVAAFSLIAFVGCGDGKPTRVSVAGTVLVDGEPLSKGNIMFVPEGGRPSYAKIGPDGRFELSCFDDDDGALVGTHQVAVTAKKIVTLNNIEWYAPKKYSDYKTSGLTVEVTEPVDDLVIKLSSEGKGKESGKAR